MEPLERQKKWTVLSLYGCKSTPGRMFPTLLFALPSIVPVPIPQNRASSEVTAELISHLPDQTYSTKASFLLDVLMRFPGSTSTLQL